MTDPGPALGGTWAVGQFIRTNAINKVDDLCYLHGQ